MKKILAASVAAGLVVGGVALAAPAFAHTPTISASCDTGVKIKATNYDHDSANTWTITVNGVTTSGSFQGGTEQTVPFPQDGTESTWSASIDAPGTQYDLSDQGKFTCGTIPTPSVTETPKPTFEPRIQDYISCKGAAFVLDNIGSTGAVTYTIAGKSFEVPAGKAIHTDADGFLFPTDIGPYVVTTYPGDKTWTFAAPKDCVVPTPEPSTPVETPEPSAPPVTKTPTPEPSTPIETPQPSEPVTQPSDNPSKPAVVIPGKNDTPKGSTQRTAADAPKSGELAFTGAEGMIQGGVAALVLLLAGTGLAFALRKRNLSN